MNSQTSSPASPRKNSPGAAFAALCIAALATGILQELVGVALDSYAGAKGYASLALFGAGFLLFGLCDKWLAQWSGLIPLLAFISTLALPLSGFNWLILSLYALLGGMTLPYCISRFLVCSKKERRFLKLGAAFSCYTVGLVFYVPVNAALPNIPLWAQFAALSLCPLSVFLISAGSAVQMNPKEDPAGVALGKTKPFLLALAAGIALLILLNYAVSRALIAGGGLPAYFMYVDAIPRFLLGIAIGARLDRKAYRLLNLGFLVFMVTGATLILFAGRASAPLLCLFNLGSMGFVYFLFFMPVLGQIRRDSVRWCGSGFFTYTAMVFVNLGLEPFLADLAPHALIRTLCLAVILLCVLLFLVLLEFLIRNHTELLVLESAARDSSFAKQGFPAFAQRYRLTAREAEVLACIVESDKSAKELADTLYIGERTLYRHLNSIYEKTGASSRMGLMLLYYHSADGDRPSQ